MIGADFEKITFDLFGLELMEPMGFITDMIMGFTSVYFGYRIFKFKSSHPFYEYWRWFYLIFGVGSIVGGFSHLLYNYWGIAGKIPAWVTAPIAVYCMEQAMISVNKNEKVLTRLKAFSFWKLVIVLITFVLVVSLNSVETATKVGFLPVAINTIVGVSFATGVMGMIYFRKGYSVLYKYFALGMLIMLPSSFVFLMKINLHPWFDKNDLSHVLITAGIFYFFLGVKRLNDQGFHQDAYI